VRGGLAAAWVVLLVWCISSAASAAPVPVLEVEALNASVRAPSVDAVVGGSLDSQFKPFDFRKTRRSGVETFWLRLQLKETYAPSSVPTISVIKGRHLNIALFTRKDGESVLLRQATALSEFGGAQEAVFVLPSDGLARGQPVYAYVNVRGTGVEQLSFSLSVLDQTLARGGAHERVMAISFGALMAVALASLMIWFVFRDPLFVLYTTLISMQALYVVYLSGYGFDWPLLSYALPLGGHAWNVPAALSGAAASLFVREIADLQRSSPRAYAVLGWMAGVFVVLALANFAKPFGLDRIVTAAGNIVFIFAALFTLVVTFRAWMRGARAAGWFLIAWGVLEIFTIATAARLLFTDADHVLYYGFPLSMVAAAILIALGVADRLHEQRQALTDAEKRAQTDPLTGVLNRRSLIERLDAACMRARARGLPIAVLFIDLDHFKEINDSYGHAAGDACLAAIIGPIQSELRQSDVIGRWGGEEFIVLLSSADTAAAHPIAERILERVADVRVDGFGKPIHLTCSIGVAASDTLGVWGEKLIAHADAAVYAAKRSGRNRVQVAPTMAA
jgi:two-component system, sensor histidine kinase LadS